ncbi:MAG: cyanophycin synthetase, partial [Myxococcota bacterium]
DHLEAHGSPEHYLASKAQLFMALPPTGTAILNGCDETAPLLAEIVPRGVKTLFYGSRTRGPAALALDLEATGIDVNWHGTTVRLHSALPLGIRTLHLPAIGAVYAENALAALLAARVAGVAPADAAHAIATCPLVPGRFEVVRRRPYAVVDYAHTPDALRRVLTTARALCKGRLTVVFGAGGDRDRSKRAAMGAAASVCDRIVLTNDNPRSEAPMAIIEALRAGIESASAVEIELERARAIALALGQARDEDVIVVAGKGHETDAQGQSDASLVRRALP